MAVVLLLGAGCGGGSSPAAPSPAAASPRLATPPASPAPTSPLIQAIPSADGKTGRPGAGPSLSGRTILIDPGHNGGNGSHPSEINALVEAGGFRKACDTAGAETNAGYTESAFTLDVSERAAALLRARGAKVVLTRADDSGVGPCVNERAAIGNRANADAAISVHADGGPPSGVGFHVIRPGLVPGYNDGIVEPSARLALDVRSAMLGTGEPAANYVATDGLITRTDLGGLNLSHVPKVFVECGNMRNAGDAAKLTDPAWRQRLAQAVAGGLATFVNGS